MYHFQRVGFGLQVYDKAFAFDYLFKKIVGYSSEQRIYCRIEMSDNQNAVRIIEVGIMKSDSHNVAFAIFKICMLSRISLEVCWIPRNEKVIADFLVKCMMQTTGALMIEFSSYLTGSGVHLPAMYLQILPISKEILLKVCRWFINWD